MRARSLHFLSLIAALLSCSCVLAQKSDNTLKNPNPAYIKFKKLDSYIPNESTPVKTVQLNFNVFTGPGTLRDNEADRASLKQMLAYVNAWYTNNAKPTDTIPGVEFIPDTKIRFEVSDRIYFYDSTQLYNSCNVFEMQRIVKATDPSRMKQLNIYFTFGPCIQNASAPYPAFDYYSNVGSMNGDQYVLMPIPAPVAFASSQTLAHELAHTLDLMHTYEASCCHETCDASSPEYLDDLFGPENKSNCWHEGGWSCDPTDPNNTCTNNMMGGVATVSYYFSPKQIAKMHRALSIKTPKKYVRDCPRSTAPVYIDKDEVWDFDMRVYSDIVVKKGATLTIKSTITIPDECRIRVERKAYLVIDGGSVTKSCAGGNVEIVQRKKKKH